MPHVKSIESPLARGNEGQISEDGGSAVVNFSIAGDEDAVSDRVSATLAATAAVQRAHPELRVEQFGGASAGKALSEAFDDDFKKAEGLSFPITLTILVLAFGALVAAGLPAAARPHRRGRHHRAARPAQPRHRPRRPGRPRWSC